jgi:cytochrome oxidase Cu insertion factor (SCO1/SenC/PrrC family)
MEDRVTLDRRAALALGALALILAITASRWPLALWPMPASTPAWLARTREVCFQTGGDGLPGGAGWLLLVGEPAGLLGVLGVVWGDALRDGLRALRSAWPGRLLLGAAGVALLAGFGWAGQRVREARAGEPFDPNAGPAPERVDLPAPALRLVDQHGDTVDPARYGGRPVVVTFAFAHCQTVCPTMVQELAAASARLGAGAPEVLIVTLDPWRDTPSRLGAIARAWGLPSGMHLLSGDVAEVERTLDAWRVPRARDGATGDLAHPRLAYLLDARQRIAYRLDGRSATLVPAVRELFPEETVRR